MDRRVEQTANAIVLHKLRAIAKRTAEGREPSVREANYAQKFTKTVSVRKLVEWIDDLIKLLECTEDKELMKQFKDNLEQQL